MNAKWTNGIAEHRARGACTAGCSLFTVLAVARILSSATAIAEEPATHPSGPNARIGVYDSRAIAVAFVGSEIYAATEGTLLAAKMAERARAKAEGNRQRVAELEAWGKAQQTLRHKQAFSTAPVDDILAHIADRTPALTRTARVERVVSKWDAETLAKYPSAERVDVTLLLIRAFNPSERQLNSAIAIQKQAPISLDRAAKIDD